MDSVCLLAVLDLYHPLLVLSPLFLFNLYILMNYVHVIVAFVADDILIKNVILMRFTTNDQINDTEWVCVTQSNDTPLFFHHVVRLNRWYGSHFECRPIYFCYFNIVCCVCVCVDLHKVHINQIIFIHHALQYIYGVDFEASWMIFCTFIMIAQECVIIN